MVTRFWHRIYPTQIIFFYAAVFPAQLEAESIGSAEFVLKPMGFIRPQTGRKHGFIVWKNQIFKACPFFKKVLKNYAK